MHVLESDVFRLEPQVAEHAEEMFEVLADPAIYEHENERIPYDHSKVEKSSRSSSGRVG